MPREPIPLDAARRVSSRALIRYARGLGWQPVVRTKRPELAVFHRPDSQLHQVAIPVDATLTDYDECVAEAVQKLADYEKRPALDVLDYLLSPPADFLGFRVVGLDALIGGVSLESGIRQLAGVRKLLLWAAHSVLKPLADFPRSSVAEAEEFVDRCRLSRTEWGGFSVDVACPLDGRIALPETEEPFARRVTSLLVETLSRIADAGEDGELLDPDRYPGIGANLCESLLMLRPVGEQSSLSVSATWSRTRLPGSGDRRIELRQEAFAVAEELAVRLRTVPGPTRSRVYGFVEALMGHPTRNDPRPSGEARFRLFEEGEELPTRAELSPADYAVAGAAHLAGDPVSFRGILHRLPRLSRVEQVAGFRRLRLEEDGAPDEVAAPPAATF